MSNGETRRQRRAAKRREEILGVAARVFAEKGYSDTKITEIADALDIADGTLYNYFDSKHDILVAVLARTYDIFVAHLPFTRTLLMEAWADDTILQEYAADHLEHMRKRARNFIVSRIDAGDFRPVDPALATQMMLGMFFAPVLPVLRGITPPPTPDQCRGLAEAAVDLLLDGIRVRPERGNE